MHLGKSTAPIERITIFDILLANNGSLTVNQITQSLDVSEPTARKTMLDKRYKVEISVDKEGFFLGRKNEDISYYNNKWNLIK